MAITKTKTVSKRKLTEEQFLHLPDDGRKYELVGGEVKEVPAGIRHDEIVMHVGFLLYPFTKGRGVLCGSSAGYRMTTGNIRSPDVSFTLKERLPEGKAPLGFGDFAPDLAIEVVSPNEDRYDLLKKIAEYFEAGAQQVWLLDPEFQRATLYRSPLEVQTLGAEEEIEGGDLLPGFRCRVKDLFEWA